MSDTPFNSNATVVDSSALQPNSGQSFSSATPVTQTTTTIPPTPPPVPNVASNTTFSSLTGATATPTKSLTPPVPPPVPTAPVQTYAQQAQDSIAAANAVPNQAETDRTSAISTLLGDYNTDQNKSADTAAFNEQYGVNSNQKMVQDLSNQIIANNAKTQTDKLSVGNNVGGVTSTDRGNFESEIDRQSAIKNLNLGAQLQAAQGNLSVAKDLAAQAIDAKYGVVEARIKNTLSYLDINKTDLERTDKKAYDDQVTMLQAKQKDLDAQKQNESDIASVSLEAAKNGAPQSVIDKINATTSKGDAVAAGAGWYQDPLDIAYKKAQIAKINDDIAKSGASGIDGAGVLAYAQQYASTGMIPTGLPKGTFGMVAQAAKELPQQPGTVVDNNTGIKSSKLTSSQEDGISALYDLTKKLDDLKTNYNSTSILSNNKDRQQYVDLSGEITDLLARARSGAAINDTELAQYQAKIPNLFSIGSLGNRPSVGNQKIDDLKSSLEGKLNTSLQSDGVSIYGYSQTNIGGHNYTVGDVIQNDKGQSARVNSDGSLTYITQ